MVVIQVRRTRGREVTVRRYQSGWKDSQQDTKIKTRSAQVQGQNFEDIRNKCLADGVLWEDPDFPPINQSVYYSSSLPQSFQWMRPSELASDPRFFVGGASRFDIKQGDLGNCWFLASIASFCSACNRSVSNDLLERVIPKDNSFVDNYAGVFHFKLWQYGKWIDVVIDDNLPTMNGRLMFMQSESNNEFWSALLEKAYAKLNGSYEALQGGCSSEAMEDLTGGVVEGFDFTKAVPQGLFKIMLKAFNHYSLMACQIDAQGMALESTLSNGLIVGHAYSITSVKQIKVRGNDVSLVRIRNPWGNQYEWKGAWSDSSPEWQLVNESEKKELEISIEEDGEFWMTFEDFKANFSKLEICNLSPDSLENEGNVKKAWQRTLHDGSWTKRVNAGGCRNFINTFWTNPQYRIEVIDPDPDDDENMGTLVIGLLQKERRKKKSEGIGYLTIGFCVYKIKDPSATGTLDINFFKYNASVAKSTFTNMREVCCRFKLPPGHYVIIPSTFQANQEGDFILRIFSEKAVSASEMDEKTSLSSEEDDLNMLDELKKHGDVSSIFNSFNRTINFPYGGMNIYHFSGDSLKRRLRSKEVTTDDVEIEKTVRAMFRDNSGEDLEMDAHELRTLLNDHFKKEYRFEGFSLETCRSMIAMLDLDKSGKLGYEEFKTMWADLRRWKKIFNEFDVDKSGTFNSFELREALRSAGINVSNKTFNGLVMRFSDSEGKIFFDEFILCSVRLKTMLDVYTEYEVNGNAQFSMDEFIQLTMYS